MKNIFRILLILAIVGVPCGTHAAKKDLTDNVTYNTPAKSFGAADANDTELYDILTGTEPTLGPLNIGGTGDSWLQLYNNTTLVDDYTSKYGIRFYNGSLYQVIDGTGSLIGSGGGTTITWQTTDPDTTDPSGLYINTTDGDAFAIDTGVGMSTWATTYTLAPTCTGTGTLGFTDTGTGTNNNHNMYYEVTATSDVCVNQGNIYVDTTFTSSNNLRVVVWDSSGNELYTSNELTGDGTAGLKTISFSSEFQINDTTAYRLGYVADGFVKYDKIVGTTNRYYQDSDTYPTTEGLTWTQGGDMSPIVFLDHD